MSLRISVAVGAAVMLLAGSALAHHNMSALFDFNDRVTLNGNLSKIDWRNPHIYLAIDVTSGAELVMPLQFFLSEVLRLPTRLVKEIAAKAGQSPHTKAAWKDPKQPGSGAGKADKSAKKGGTSRNGSAKR